LLVFAGEVPGADEGWDLWSERDGVRVFKKASASGYLEVRATTEVRSSLSAFVALLHDTVRVPDWMESVSEITVTYSEYHQPSPCSLVLEISDVHDVIPEQDNYVRILDVSTRWTLTKSSDGNTQIEYLAYANPSGNLPAWIANRATLKETLKSLRALRKVLTEDRYQNQLIEGISECPELTGPRKGESTVQP